MSLSGAQITAFVREATEYGSVWAIRDSGGYPAPKNADGERAMPFWSTRSRVEKIMQNVPAYRPFEAEEIELERWLDWLVDLEKDGLKIGLNWYGKRATGWHLTSTDVRARFGRPAVQEEIADTSPPAKSIFSRFADWLNSKA